MKKAAFILALIIFILAAEVKGDIYPFILNPGFRLNNKIDFSAEYVFNLVYWNHLMDHPGWDEPSYDREAPIYFYRTFLAYKRFDFDLVYSEKEKSSYSLGQDCTYNMSSPSKERSLQASVKACLIKGKYANFGLAVTNISLWGFVFSKNFQKFSYSLVFDKLLLFHLYYRDMLGILRPYSGIISIAYTPLRNLGFFNEFKWHQYYYGEFRSGYMNICGMSYQYKIFRGAIFYTIIYDGDDYNIGMCSPDRFDHRIGFQVKIGK